jgi:hypothetical protein
MLFKDYERAFSERTSCRSRFGPSRRGICPGSSRDAIWPRAAGWTYLDHAGQALDAAIFEAVHGSAPNIAGEGIANPLALLLAAFMMLDHIDRSELAHQLRKAINQTLNEDQVRTGDLGGKASTKEFAQAIVRRSK